MYSKVITTAALLGMSASVQAVGRAVVVNQCSDAITLTNVPASGGGQSQIGPEQLAQGASYSQQYTQLSNGQGWSIKLSQGNDMTDIVQFEYTYQGDGQIWYDLSAVNGDPWNGDWAISASGGCDPHNTAYRYPTDDTYGMQDSCPDDSTVTVTMCASGSGGGAAPPSESAPAPSYAPQQSAQPSYAPSAPPSRRPGARPDANSQAPPVPSVGAQVSVPAAPVPSNVADNFQGAQKADDDNAFQNFNAAPTVTHVATTVVTQFVTISPSPVKRSEEHIHRHADHHH